MGFYSSTDLTEFKLNDILILFISSGFNENLIAPQISFLLTRASPSSASSLERRWWHRPQAPSFSSVSSFVRSLLAGEGPNVLENFDLTESGGFFQFSKRFLFDQYKVFCLSYCKPDVMSRRVPSRRPAESSSLPLIGSLNQKSKTSPLLSIGLIVLGAILLIVYSYSGSGVSTNVRESFGGEGALLARPCDLVTVFHEMIFVASCTSEVQHAIPVLKKVYGDSMRKVLHVGPDTCSVVTKLLKEEGTEAWGVEPYDLEDADSNCKSLVRKGFVRAADIKFSLPYRPKSFSLVITSDTVDYLSPKYLNRTIPDLARVSADGLVIFAGYPSHHRAKISELPKFGRPAKSRNPSWWLRYFISAGLEENEAAAKKFEQAAAKVSYKPGCQIFHLSS
ncbi:hypothetical protein M5K25_019921 [Dendrobium thyrsiflorum]|uniref:Uncharacterized protein n=1 Tax=Dendrobium thyrsiflorum TaxID=117978 RepID=A0ABD0UG94_DENTH